MKGEVFQPGVDHVHAKLLYVLLALLGLVDCTGSNRSIIVKSPLNQNPMMV
jgi:hypothetical protein